MISQKSYSKPSRGRSGNMKINAPFVEKVLTAFIKDELHKFNYKRGNCLPVINVTKLKML